MPRSIQGWAFVSGYLGCHSDNSWHPSTSKRRWPSVTFMTTPILAASQKRMLPLLNMLLARSLCTGLF